MTEPTPRTEAGRLLLARLEWSAQRHEVEPSSALDLAQRSILAIEAEAAAQARTEALDVEALAEAWANVMDGRRIGSGLNAARIGRETTTSGDWTAIAREYRAILAAKETP